MPCDLHVHTTASDGLLSPDEVTLLAKEKGLRAIALCDHDTISGVLSLMKDRGSSERILAGGVEVVPGIEINSQWNGREIHILGYYVRLEDPEFLNLMEKLREARLSRAKLMVERLRELGKPLDFDRVLEVARGDSIGRPHVAQVMVERGYVNSVKEAFRVYLGIGRPAYVERLHLGPVESVQAVRRAGGVAVWAHPGTARVDQIFADLLDGGLQGIEVYHPEHDAAMEEKYLNLARENGLVATGGSDFHGPGVEEGGTLGSHVVPYEVVLRLKDLASSAAKRLYRG